MFDEWGFLEWQSETDNVCVLFIRVVIFGKCFEIVYVTFVLSEKNFEEDIVWILRKI